MARSYGQWGDSWTSITKVLCQVLILITDGLVVNIQGGKSPAGKIMINEVAIPKFMKVVVTIHLVTSESAQRMTMAHSAAWLSGREVRRAICWYNVMAGAQKSALERLGTLLQERQLRFRKGGVCNMKIQKGEHIHT